MSESNRCNSNCRYWIPNQGGCSIHHTKVICNDYYPTNNVPMTIETAAAVLLRIQATSMEVNDNSAVSAIDIALQCMKMAEKDILEKYGFVIK